MENIMISSNSPIDFNIDTDTDIEHESKETDHLINAIHATGLSIPTETSVFRGHRKRLTYDIC